MPLPPYPSLATLPEVVPTGKVPSSYVAGLSWVALSELLPTATSDSALGFGSGTTDGIDRTSALNAILSGRLASGNYGLLWDLAITANVAIYGSNVTIRGLHPGCGIRRPQAWAGPTIRNGSPILGLNGSTPVAPSIGQVGEVTLGGYSQSEITLDGLTIQGGLPGDASKVNLGGSTGGYNGVQMWGIDGFAIRNCRIYDSGRYQVSLANIRRGRVSESTIKVSVITSSDGRDGIHLNGPALDFIGEGNTIASGDDALTAQPNDGNPAGLPYPYALAGPVTGVKYLNNRLEGCGGGFRFLSSDQLLDDVIVQGNTGTTQIYAALIDTYVASATPAGNNPHPGSGNIGKITFIDNDIQCLSGTGSLGNVWINANFDAIEFRGHKVRPVSAITSPILTIFAGTSYNSFALDFQLTDLDSGNVARVIVQDNGAGLTAAIKGRLSRPGLANQAIPLYRQSAGSLGQLLIEAEVESINNLVDYAGGTISSATLRGVHRNAGAGNGSVAVGSGLTLTNLGTHGLITLLAKSGSGTVTHQYPTGQTYSL